VTRPPPSPYDSLIAPGPTSPRARDAEARQTIIRRRRLALAGAIAALAALIVGAIIGASAGGGDPETAVEESSTAELPRGGTEILPGNLLVGFYGAPQDEELGALGIGSPEEASAALAEQAAAYEGNRPVLPFLELIAVVANADPGEDGMYRTRQPSRVIDEYLAEARSSQSLLVLDIQPGSASFQEEFDVLLPYLREPDVGLALDPEWHVPPGVAPGSEIGSVEAETVNSIAAQLSILVEEHDLPQKLLIVHRFTADMVTDPEELRPQPGVALVLNVDGFGVPEEKTAKYEELQAPRGSGLFSGFKLFYKEDTDLMSPNDVLSLKQKPDLVIYE